MREVKHNEYSLGPPIYVAILNKYTDCSKLAYGVANNLHSHLITTYTMLN